MIYKWFGKEFWNLLFDIENFKLKMSFCTYKIKKNTAFLKIYD